MKGFSLTLCVGKYGGFYCKTSLWVTRLCLGWVAFTIYWQTDIEEFITYLKTK